MKYSLVLGAVVIGIVVGSSVYAACVNRVTLGPPCNGIELYFCPAGCTKTETNRDSRCVAASGSSGGCCMYVEADLTCSGGQCSSCSTFQDVAVEYTGYYPNWCCQDHPNGHSKVCAPCP